MKEARPPYWPNERERRALACVAAGLRLHADHWRSWGRPDSRVPAVALYRPDGSFLLVGHPRPPQEAPWVWWNEEGTSGLRMYEIAFGSPPVPSGGVVGAPYRGVDTLWLPLAWSGEDAAHAVRLVGALCFEAFRSARLQEGFPRNYPLMPDYPEDSAVNNAFGTLEGQLLHECLSLDAEEAKERARAFALIRRERRALLDDETVAYEQVVELDGGLATYAELHACAALRAGASAELLGRFWDPEEIKTAATVWMEHVIAQLDALSRRGVGARFWRFFYSGLGIALLLDKTNLNWKSSLNRGSLLDDFVEQVVTFDGGEVDEQIIAETELRLGFAERLEEERQNTRGMRETKARLAAEALDGPGTRFVFDISALERTFGHWTFVGEGLKRSGVRLHPTRAYFAYGPTTLAFEGVAVVEDSSAGVLEVCVPYKRFKMVGDETRLHLIRPAEFTEGFELSLGGVHVRAREGSILPVAGAIYVQIRR